MQDIPCVLFAIFSSDNDIFNGFRAKHMYARHIICDYDWSEHCPLCPIYGIISPYVYMTRLSCANYVQWPQL